MLGDQHLHQCRFPFRADRIGMFAGKDADLVLVDGDPIARMSDVRKVVTVIKAGAVYDAAAVYATVGVRP